MRDLRSRVADARASASTLLCLSALTLGGCSTIGTSSIDQGRTPYNEVIQGTSQQQTLLNLVRVHDGETPFFMDVTEVDQATTVVGSIMGGPSGIGATPSNGGLVGSVTGTASYTEAPTVRYVPLLGAALIAQVSTPITAQSIADLYNSGWPLGAIFDLSVERFTPGYDEYFAALNALIELDRFGAIVVGSSSGPQSGDGGGAERRTQGFSFPATPSARDQSLVIYFRPELLRAKFRECDRGREISRREAPLRPPEEKDISGQAAELWRRLQTILKQTNSTGYVVLNTKSATDLFGASRTTNSPSPEKGMRSNAGSAGSSAQGNGTGKSPDVPLLRTRSALGVMKNAAEGDNLVAFLAPDAVDHIIQATHDNVVTEQQIADPKLRNHCNSFFYKTGDDEYDGVDDSLRWSNARFTRRSRGSSVTNDLFYEERVFSVERRLILVQVTNERPANAFSPVFHEGRWYSIEDRDFISKRNLELFAEINTIQAIPSQTPPLTPTIAVGGRGS